MDPTQEIGKKLFGAFGMGGEKTLVSYSKSKAVRPPGSVPPPVAGPASAANMMVKERMQQREASRRLERLQQLMTGTLEDSKEGRKAITQNVKAQDQRAMQTGKRNEKQDVLLVKRHKEIVKLLKNMLSIEKQQLGAAYGGYGSRFMPGIGGGGRGKGGKGKKGKMGWGSKAALAAGGGSLAADMVGGDKKTPDEDGDDGKKKKGKGGKGKGARVKGGKGGIPGLKIVGGLAKGALGVAGGVLGIMAINDGMNSIRSRKGEKFMGEGEGLEGFMDSKAADYLMNAGAGALTGAALGSVIPVIGTGIGAAVGGAIGLGGSLYADFEQAINAAFASIGDFIKNADWKAIGKQVGEFLKETGAMLVDALSKAPGMIWDAGVGVFGFVAEWGPVILNAAWGLVTGIFDGLLGGLGEAAGDAGNWVMGKMGEFGGWIQKTFNDFWSMATGWVMDAWDAVTSALPWSDKSQANDIYSNAIMGNDIVKSFDGKSEGVVMSVFKQSKEGHAKATAQLVQSENNYKAAVSSYGKDSTQAKDAEKEVNLARMIRNRAGRALDQSGNKLKSMGIMPDFMFQNAATSIGSAEAVTPKRKATDAEKATSKKDITYAAKAMGIDPALMQGIAARESSFDTFASNDKSSAAGLFQFIDKTWDSLYAKYGEAYGLKNDKTDSISSSFMAALLIKENSAILQKGLGRKPKNEEIYLAHFMGPEKAVQFIIEKTKNPTGAAAGSVSKSVIAANPTIFTPGATNADVYRSLTHNMGDASLAKYSATATPAKPKMGVDAAKLPTRPATYIPAPSEKSEKSEMRSASVAAHPYTPPDNIGMGDELALSAANTLRGA